MLVFDVESGTSRDPLACLAIGDLDMCWVVSSNALVRMMACLPGTHAAVVVRKAAKQQRVCCYRRIGTHMSGATH